MQRLMVFAIFAAPNAVEPFVQMQSTTKLEMQSSVTMTARDVPPNAASDLRNKLMVALE